jgi:hypothetical protein
VAPVNAPAPRAPLPGAPPCRKPQGAHGRQGSPLGSAWRPAAVLLLGAPRFWPQAPDAADFAGVAAAAAALLNPAIGLAAGWCVELVRGAAAAAARRGTIAGRGWRFARRSGTFLPAGGRGRGNRVKPATLNRLARRDTGLSTALPTAPVDNPVDAA